MALFHDVVPTTGAPEAHSVHVEVHDGSGVEREHLAKNQTADDCYAERAPEFGTDTTSQR